MRYLIVLLVIFLLGCGEEGDQPTFDINVSVDQQTQTDPVVSDEASLK